MSNLTATIAVVIDIPLVSNELVFGIICLQQTQLDERLTVRRNILFKGSVCKRYLYEWMFLRNV